MRRTGPQWTGPHREVDLSPGRQVVLTFLDLSSWGHYMFALLEVDVTRARRLMDDHQARTGERLSFTGYLTYCLARAVDADRSVQAYLKGRRRLVMFDDVDVGLMIERQVGESRAPGGYVLRAANHKTFEEIHREIRAVQAGRAAGPAGMPVWLRLLPRLPGPAAGLVTASIRAARRRDPARAWVPMVGTVAVTAVGMFGSGGGWPLAAPDGHTLCLFVGGIASKPVVVEDRIEVREMLSVTVGFDHDVVDGAPAARFVGRLKDLIESGDGLPAGEEVDP